MALPLTLLRQLEAASPDTAWASLFGHAWNTCSAPLVQDKAPSEVTKRDAELGAADLFLATAGWDLWKSYETVVPRTADTLASWWAERDAGRAVLILDALSLREVPWLLQGAKERGYTLHQARATGAELPADTTPFAEALGFTSRSALQNNLGAGKGRLTGATTDSTNLPWEDCAAQITSKHDWLLWHDWLDERLHELRSAGPGITALAKDAAEQLSSDAFWTLVHTLTTGRRPAITLKLYESTGCADVTCSGDRWCHDFVSNGETHTHTAVRDGWVVIVVDASTAFDDEGRYTLNVTLSGCAVAGCECP